MTGPLGVYVHWPYCARICPYCDFNVFKAGGREAEAARLARAIVADLEAQAALTGPRQLVSIFFGGGTPSLMDPRTAEAVIRASDLVVFATGYKGYEETLPAWFGKDVASRVGKVWGIDPVTGELSNMWTPTAQPGLWFAGGSFVHSRIYAKYLALQIKAEEEGLCA